jgi:ATP:ADP antiporter, AAA family
MFNIMEEEISPMMFLMIFSFFMGTSVAFFFTVSISTFLKSFDSSYLPWSYLLSGFTGYILWWVYSRLGLKIKFSWLPVIFLSMLLVSVTILCLLYIYMPSRWLSFVLLVWVSAFIFVKGICFWGTASRIFNIGQAKRVFGVISIGEVISNLIGFFSIPFLLPVLGKAGLLIISAAAIAASLVVISIIIKKNARALTGKNTELKRKLAVQRNNVTLRDNYFLLVLLFAIIPVFVFYFIDYMFMKMSAAQFPDNESFAAFMGIFMGFVALLELFLKGIVFSRLVKNYGVKSGILAMAFLLLISTAFALLAGTWLAAGTVFFSAIALSKLLERSVSSGIMAPSLQILYQPVDSGIRTVFQSKTDGLSSSAGNIVAGGLLLIFQYIGFTNLVAYNVLLLGLIVTWIVLGLKVYSAYKFRLGEALASRGQKSIRQPLFLSSDFITSQLKSGNKKLSIAAARLISHSDPDFTDTREKPTFSNLDLIASEGGTGYNDIGSGSWKINYFPEKGADPEIAGENNNVAQINFLLKSEDKAMILAGINLAAENPEPAFRPYLIQLLQRGIYTEAVKKALAIYGDQVSADLDMLFHSTSDLILRLKILEIWSRINTQLSNSKLLARIDHSSREIWIGAVKGLERNRYKSDEKTEALIKEKISSVVKNIVWIHSCLTDLGKSESRLVQALNSEKAEFTNLLYALLGFICEHSTTDLIKANFADSRDLDGVIYAKEVIDNFFQPKLKDLVLPVFEGHSSATVLQKYSNIFPMQTLSHTERLVNIMYYDYSQIGIWTRACALNECRDQINDPSIRNEIIACLHHSSAMLRELALSVLINSGRLEGWEIPREKLINQVNEQYRPLEKKTLSAFEKALLLREIPLFGSAPSYILLNIADKCTEVTYQKSVKVKPEGKAFIIVEGQLSLCNAERKVVPVKNRSVIIPGIFPPLQFDYFNIETETRMLCCETDLLTDMFWTDLRQAEAYFRYAAGSTIVN